MARIRTGCLLDAISLFYCCEMLSLDCSVIYFQYIHAIVQLVDFDWPANILAGSHFWAQETQPLSPDGVCALV